MYFSAGLCARSEFVSVSLWAVRGRAAGVSKTRLSADQFGGFGRGIVNDNSHLMGVVADRLIRHESVDNFIRNARKMELYTAFVKKWLRFARGKQRNRSLTQGVSIVT